MITWTEESSKKATVIGEKMVSYENEQYTLSGLGKMLYKEIGKPKKTLQGSRVFTFNDIKIIDLPNVKYNVNDDE